MAFGFPASHTEKYSTEIENEKVFDLFKEVISGFGWEIDTHIEEGILNKIIAKVPSNANSWGLKVEVSNIKPGLFEIKSKSILQVIDYGANEKAVKKIMSSLNNAIKNERENKEEIKASDDMVIKENKYSEFENSKKAKYDKSKIPDGSVLEIKKVGRFIKAYDANGNDLSSIVSSKTRQSANTKGTNIQVSKDKNDYLRWNYVKKNKKVSSININNIVMDESQKRAYKASTNANSFNFNGYLNLAIICLIVYVGYSLFFGGVKGDIKREIASKLADSNFELRDVSGPYKGKVFVPTSGNKGVPGKLPSGCSTFETYTVAVAGNNSFGGKVVNNWFTIMDKDGICGSFSEQDLMNLGGAWNLSSTFRLLAPECNCD